MVKTKIGASPMASLQPLLCRTRAALEAAAEASSALVASFALPRPSL